LTRFLFANQYPLRSKTLFFDRTGQRRHSVRRNQ